MYRLDGDPGGGPAGVRMLVGGQQPGVLDTGTGRLAALPIPVARGDVAELDHAGGTTTALLHNAIRLRSRAFVIGPSGKAVRLGRVLDLLPLRDGGVLTEDCADAWGAGPCTLTGYGASGTIGWKRTVPGPLDMIRDTPYGLVVDAYQGDVGSRSSWRTRGAERCTGSSAGRARCSAPTTGRWCSSRPAAARTPS